MFDSFHNYLIKKLKQNLNYKNNLLMFVVSNSVYNFVLWVVERILKITIMTGSLALFISSIDMVQYVEKEIFDVVNIQKYFQ